MKRLLLIAGLAIAAIGFTASPVLANNGSDTTVIHYTATYVDGIVGPVTCTGVHQTGKNFPGTDIAGGQDSFTCTSTTGSPLTNVTPGELDQFGVNGWISDYFFFVDPLTPGAFVFNTKPFTLTVSSDGFSYSGTAPYYPAS